ncbi:MAG TPA: hypothetical protein VGH63_13710 [Polyangia bacterium]|jgi:hypothetical protein
MDSDTRRRPSELRERLEAEARRIVDEARSSSVPVEPAEIAARVVAAHQDLPDVRQRLEFMWRHLEEYVTALLAERER